MLSFLQRPALTARARSGTPLAGRVLGLIGLALAATVGAADLRAEAPGLASCPLPAASTRPAST